MSAWPFGYPPGSNRSMSSTYFKTCSSHAACRRTSVLITAPGSSPRRCGIGSALSAQRPPTSARGRTGTSKALMRGSAASFSMARSSTHCAKPRSSSRVGDGTITLPAACLDRLPGSGPGGVRPRPRRIAGCAIPTSSAGRAPAGAKANPKLTFKPDHQAGGRSIGLRSSGVRKTRNNALLLAPLQCQIQHRISKNPTRDDGRRLSGRGVACPRSRPVFFRI